MHASPRPRTCSRCARPFRSRAGPRTRRPSSSPSSSATGSSRTARARRWTTGARRPRRSSRALEADGEALLGDDLFAGEAILARVAAWDGPQGAKMALDGVVHDWLGKRVGQPVWRLLGHRTRDAADLVHDRHRHGRGHRGQDAPRAPATRCSRSRSAGRATSSGCGRCGRRPRRALRIDGNEGWDLETARALTPELIALGVEFVEQPFPAEDIDSFLALPRAARPAAGADRRGLPRPARPSPRSPEYADGIVIKLSKCGGIREALRMIHAARALELKVMLGCMIESELGIAQAAQLGSLGRLHRPRRAPADLRRSRSRASGCADGRLVLSERPGPGRGAAMADRLALFTGGQFAESNAKTAHGILRYGEREIIGVVDSESAAATAVRGRAVRAAGRADRGDASRRPRAGRKRARDRRRAVRRRADRRVARGAAGSDRRRDERRGGAAHGARRGSRAVRGGGGGRRRAARPARRAAGPERARRPRAARRARRAHGRLATARSARCR